MSTPVIPDKFLDLFTKKAFAHLATLMPSGEPVNMVTAVLRFTAPFNITGQPALAIPTGLAPNGLPLSMQVIGRPFDEMTVFRVGAAYEEARGQLPEPKL